MSVRLVNPESLAKPVGYSHAAVGAGRPVVLAGQVGWDAACRFEEGVVAQFGKALDNLLEALAAAGGKPEDMAVFAFRDLTPGFEREFVVRMPSFWTSEKFLRQDGQLTSIDVPDDAKTRVHREWLAIQMADETRRFSGNDL